MKSPSYRACLASTALALLWSFSVVGRSVHAAPIFEYAFPASWDGVAASITDLSGAGNNSTRTGGPVLSTNVPSGSPVGDQSIRTSGGGFRTDNPSLLTNAAIAAAGGFRFDATIYWDGANNANGIHKIIDYAGTEFLQLQNVNVAVGSANLRFGFNDAADPGTLITAIVPNQWYVVSGIFNSQGNAVAPDGSLSGQATLIVNGASIVENVSKTNFGDGLNRRIAVGNFSAVSSALLQFRGDIYQASVTLIPEPATAALVAGFAAVVALGKMHRRGF